MISSQPFQIALRTYALALSLSLGPSLLPFLTSYLRSQRNGYKALKRVLWREIRLDGFAFAITLSVGGGVAIKELWRVLDDFLNTRSPKNFSSPKLSHIQKTFIANVLSSSLGIMLLQSREHRTQRNLASSKVHPLTGQSISAVRISNTFDLTLLFLTRAVDVILQASLRGHSGSERQKKDLSSSLSSKIDAKQERLVAKTKEKSIRSLSSQIDAFVFWACSARIMWCFFYQPERLPRSYVKWIATLANLDRRVIQTLRLIREGRWSYIRGSQSYRDILTGFSEELGYSASWGDPASLPAYGGAIADNAWKGLGIKNRPGVGGLPCELVHGTVGSSLGLAGSCSVNFLVRGIMAFLDGIAIYLPVHFLPILLTRPRTLLNARHIFAVIFGTLRSATFLSSFVALYWYSVCITRSLIFARFLPFISHDFWDGPLGCIFAGCMVCGSSIWIENGRRRGEMALYVLPRAIRTCLPDTWMRNNINRARILERITFCLTFSSLMTASIHHPETLRGLSRWIFSFILNGPNTPV